MHPWNTYDLKRYFFISERICSLEDEWISVSNKPFDGDIILSHAWQYATKAIHVIHV